MTRESKKLSSLLPSFLILLSLPLLLLFSSFSSPPTHRPSPNHLCTIPTGNLTRGHWTQNPHYKSRTNSLYNSSCSFHRNSWNCLRNGRENMERMNSWVWIAEGFGGSSVPRINPAEFLSAMRGRRLGFVGDSLNENMVVALLCALGSADLGARKWKGNGAWRGGFFPRFDFRVGYHRAVLLAKFTWQPLEQLDLPNKDVSKGFYKVDVDIPADDWANIAQFYDVLVFNTGHWWGLDKFPKERPLVFYKGGKPIVPPLGILDGLELVLQNMISYINREIPKNVIKIWRTQSPRHFYGGEWNQNGSCLSTEPLKLEELDSWFDPRNEGVNKEAREVNTRIERAIEGTDIQLLNLTHLSEFRADAHPAIWLGKKDAVAIWGQDCMHWCLPGLPDTWVDILSMQILCSLQTER